MSNLHSTSDKPYLGRCNHPGCGYALFATPDQVEWTEDWKGVVAGGAPKKVGNNGVFARCPDRHKVFMLRQIKGTYSKDHKCDSRCLNAKGHNCTCSCGGLNHGKGFAIETVTTRPAVNVTIDHDIANKPASETYTPTPGTVDGIVHPISPAQVRLVIALLNERELPAKGDITPDARREAGIAAAPTLTQRQARITIDWLKTLPYRVAI